MNGKRPPHGRPSGAADDGPGGALAPTEDVARDDEEPVGVERCAGADEAGPPARETRARADVADDVAVPGEGVLDEHGVVTGGRQRAPGLVGHGDVAQDATALQGEVADRDEPPVAHGVTRAPDRCGRPRRGGRHDGAPRTRACRTGSGAAGSSPGAPHREEVAAQQTGVWHWDS